MADVVSPVAGHPSVAETPLVGLSTVTAAVTGTAYGFPGVSGTSYAPVAPAGLVTTVSATATYRGDGVLGQGGNGVHGVAVAGSGAKPKLGCGVLGESQDGYGVFAASKNATAIYAAGGTGQLAGEFDGNVSITGTLATAGDITAKDITVTGVVTASDVVLVGADCAEDFDVLGDTPIEPGSVVVFDDSGVLTPSTHPYDRRVAGVISGAGQFRPGMVLDRRATGQARAPIALVGKVYCKVDAGYGPIEVGDLLTTSPTPGCAMTATDPGRAFGAVIGKALRRHHEGAGLIPILVSLQ